MAGPKAKVVRNKRGRDFPNRGRVISGAGIVAGSSNKIGTFAARKKIMNGAEAAPIALGPTYFDDSGCHNAQQF